MLASHPLTALSSDALAASGVPQPGGRQGDSEGSAEAPEVSSQPTQAPAAAEELGTQAVVAARLAPTFARPAGLRLPPVGRPPLPRALPPSSATSSRASSPRSSLSAQGSLHTLDMARMGQFRAGARTFKPDIQPRKGLNTGDVVAFMAQGKLLTVSELTTDPQEVSTVHFGFQQAKHADSESSLAHLEVVKQGKWLGFRSASVGDRFLQARKRSPNRLVFFSHNVGTWEQWELAAGGADPDAADWASLALTLRHRRLPQFELAVEVVRVGTVSLAPNAAITPRTMLATAQQAAAAGGAGEEDPTLERRELKKMSGVLVHEWLHYVDQEKAARLAIEGRMVQMAEDAAGLRDWAVMQVDSVRQELSEEVQLLLDTISRKSAKLADVESRLTGRLRWGVAMIQAKSELNVKRQVFMWWRWLAARKKYCRHVESKLQERSKLRLAARALQGWVDHTEHRQAVGAALRTAVQRMSFVKLYQAFTGWQDLVAYKRQQEADRTALVEAVCQHMQRWRLRRLLRDWQQHAANCCHARQLLQRMACQADQQAVVRAFGAWRTHAAQQQKRLASFSALAAVRRQQRAQQQAFQGWRLLVDDEYGARLQLQHAQQLLARLRMRQAFGAWQEWRQQRADRRQRWEATITYMRQRAAALSVDAAFTAWQEHVADQKEKRAVFYNAVQHLALRKMSTAFQYWRYLTAYRQHTRAVVEQSAVRLSQRALGQAWEAWQQHVSDCRVARHRIAICQQRQELGLQRSVLAGWRHVAGLQAAEHQMVQLCHKRSDRNRMSLALAAFQAHAEQAASQREHTRMAVNWYADSLQARAFAALVEAVQRRRLLEHQLAAVAQRAQQDAVREAFSAWRSCAALSTSETQLVAAAQRRFARMRLQSRFSAWQAATEQRRQQEARLQRHLRQQAARTLATAFATWQSVAEREQDLQQRLAVCVTRIAQMRMAWALDVWRQAAAASVAEQQLVAAGQRRIARIKLTAAFAGWQQHSAALAAGRAAAEQMAASSNGMLLHGCLVGWADFAAYRGQQKAAMMQLVQRRVTWMTLNVLHQWRAYVQHKQQQRTQLQRVVRKLAGVCQRHAFMAWRQHKAWQRAEATRLAVAERRIAARHATRSLADAFRGWRSHAVTLAAARAAVAAKVHAQGAVVRCHVLATWRSHTAAQAVRHDHILRVCVARQCNTLQSRALVAWQLFAQRQAHNCEAVEVMVHRMARRLMHAALLTWRQAAQERRVRRTAIARFIQRWDAHRKSAALSHWRRLLVERREAQDNLKRCLIRKRVSFRLFRQWYWESFDDDMQETLRTMFEITEEAALDPLPSRAGSPYGSLLSSPIRQQVYGMARQQQLQLTTGVAEALARPGATQPAFMRSADQQQQQDSRGGSGGYGSSSSSMGLYTGGLGLPQLPQREPLSSRLAAAAAAHNGSAHNARAAPAAANLGGTALAPLREYAAFSLHSNAMLAPVPEVAESPYAARSPGGPGLASPLAAGHAASLADAIAMLSGGKASSTASTALPGSPLTPCSAFAAGSSPPPTGVSRLATPTDSLQQQLSPGGLFAAATPGAGGLAALHQLSAQHQQYGGSPLAALSDAPTPAYSLVSASRSQLADTLHGFALHSPLTRYLGSTPQPDFGYGLSPTAGGGGGGGFDESPAAAQRFADAPTPLAHLGLQGQYEIRRFSDGTEFVAAAGMPHAGEYGTPLAAQKTPPPGLLELRGDYGIRSFPGSTGGRGHGSGLQDGSEADLSAAKTPVIHFNPLAM